MYVFLCLLTNIYFPLIQEKKKHASKLHNYKEMASNIELNMTFMFTKNWKRNLL